MERYRPGPSQQRAQVQPSHTTQPPLTLGTKLAVPDSPQDWESNVLYLHRGRSQIRLKFSWACTLISIQPWQSAQMPPKKWRWRSTGTKRMEGSHRKTQQQAAWVTSAVLRPQSWLTVFSKTNTKVSSGKRSLEEKDWQQARSPSHGDQS